MHCELQMTNFYAVAAFACRNNENSIDSKRCEASLPDTKRDKTRV